jgi:transglutaminase-like putative cysteine protease
VFDAVQALDHMGSCVSSANLAAALLRANGIPARVLGGYPSWASGPMQCHFIVEAFVPGYGWFPLEPTQGRAPVRPSDQVQVSIVPPEYEDLRAVDRTSGVPGLLYLSISETLGDARAFWVFGALDRELGAAVAVTQPQRYARDASEWEQAFRAARARWAAWLAQKPALDAGGVLHTPLAADSLLGIPSPSALVGPAFGSLVRSWCRLRPAGLAACRTSNLAASRSVSAVIACSGREAHLP